MFFSDTVVKTFYWLNSERAAAIAAICKRHGATVKRLAQKRGCLGYCKVQATFARHSWAASFEDCRAAVSEVQAAGLVNSLTFQS